MLRNSLFGLVIGVTLCGCGTMDNMRDGERRVYGGVRQDAQHVANGKAVAVLDVPLSAVADTVTLPVTVGRALVTPR